MNGSDVPLKWWDGSAWSMVFKVLILVPKLRLPEEPGGSLGCGKDSWQTFDMTHQRLEMGRAPESVVCHTPSIHPPLLLRPTWRICRRGSQRVAQGRYSIR